MKTIRHHISDVSEAMTLLDLDEIKQVVNIIRVIKQGGGTMYLFGNGGSHATASHFANDLMKMARVKAVCVGDMSAALLAYGNDEGWENMFVGPLSKMLAPNDGVLGISCGGSSRNVIQGLIWAVAHGNLAVGLTGLGDLTEINQIGLEALVHVRSADIRAQEDVHLMICHAVVRSLQEEE